MGSLTPGITLIYERTDNRIYAREMGKTDRQLVGWTTSGGIAMQEYHSEINNVLTMCESDPAMRELLDRLFVMYNLKKCQTS